MDIFDIALILVQQQKPAFISTQVLGGRYLFLDLQPKRQEPLSVVCAGREECTPDYRIQRRGFRYHAVEYVFSGQWELTLGSRRRMLGPGSIFSYGPDVRYTLSAMSPTGLVKFFVDFSGTSAPRLLKNSGLGKGKCLRLTQTRWLHELFDQLLDCANLSRPAARTIGARLTELLLLRIHEDSRLSQHTQSEAQRTFERCRDYICEHYQSLMSVSKVASACNIDAAYLCRLFKRYADENPLQLLTRMKMDHAAELLIRGDLSVKQAGAALGFQDPYHFSRVFKRIHGVAPGKFSRS